MDLYHLSEKHKTKIELLGLLLAGIWSGSLAQSSQVTDKQTWLANHRPSCLVKCISYAVLKIGVGHSRKAIVGKMCHCMACLQKKTNSHWSTRHVLTFLERCLCYSWCDPSSSPSCVTCQIFSRNTKNVALHLPGSCMPQAFHLNCERSFSFSFHSSFDLYVTCTKQ